MNHPKCTKRGTKSDRRRSRRTAPLPSTPHASPNLTQAASASAPERAPTPTVAPVLILMILGVGLVAPHLPPQVAQILYELVLAIVPAVHPQHR